MFTEFYALSEVSKHTHGITLSVDLALNVSLQMALLYFFPCWGFSTTKVYRKWLMGAIRKVEEGTAKREEKSDEDEQKSFGSD
ncbi:hypothetical protein RRG08_042707 [Elysia crispata]|uniref:Uncharacterized protein n=1 Tax=Elysia crispata TaxID=231223 RepID=A0AAE0XQ85_9GAST|nr:hypothetical protein RRG08_042707 [Elysia crispata]